MGRGEGLSTSARLETGVTIKTEHRISLEVRKRIEILSEARHTLEQRIQRALSSCIMLDVHEPHASAPVAKQERPTPPPATVSEDPARLTREWREFSANTSDGFRRSTRSSDSRFASTPTFSVLERVAEFPSMHEHLDRQVALLGLTRSDREIAGRLVESLDEHGLLDPWELTEIVRSVRASAEDVARVRDRLQHLDPCGLASVSVRECLTVQAQEHFPDDPILPALIEDHLDELANHDEEAVARAMKVTLADLQASVTRLRRLDPHPGSRFRDDRLEHVLPEAILRERDGRIAVEMVRPGPRLRIHPEYRKLLEQAQLGRLSQKERSRLRADLAEASNLIQGLEERTSSLKAIIEKLADLQADFLLGRSEQPAHPAYPAPLLQKDVAVALEIDESTVSRALADKYVQTPRGMLPLKALFARPFANINGAAYSIHEVHGWLRAIIKAEDPKRPLSDDAIRGRLERDHGLSLSRRSVLNYREALGYGSSRERAQRRLCA